MTVAGRIKTPTDLAGPVARELARAIEVFDAEVRSDMAGVNRLLDQVRSYRGKLLRPTLLLLSGKAAGKLRPEHPVLAAVVEMVHMATLVHDDVLDEAAIRRRQATVNDTVGNEGAVLLGDYLISHAYHLCSSLGSTRASRRIAAATNTVCEGELMQIEHRGDFALDEPAYLEIIRRKTAALTGVCCELGAEFAGAGPEAVREMAGFGTDLGVAFQIVDDVLDLTADEAQTGKTAGRDADLGELTLPLIRYFDRAGPREREELVAVLSNGELHKSARVRALLAGGDAVDYALEAARSFVWSAVAHLACLPHGDAKDALAAAAEFVIRRRE
jgi:octaprenyl-diphosphate synthase